MEQVKPKKVEKNCVRRKSNVLHVMSYSFSVLFTGLKILNIEGGWCKNSQNAKTSFLQNLNELFDAPPQCTRAQAVRMQHNYFIIPKLQQVTDNFILRMHFSPKIFPRLDCFCSHRLNYFFSSRSVSKVRSFSQN